MSIQNVAITIGTFNTYISQGDTWIDQLQDTKILLKTLLVIP